MSLSQSEIQKSCQARLHSFGTLAYFGVLLLMAMVYTHPFYLFVLGGAAVIGIFSCGAAARWRQCMSWTTGLAVTMAVINLFLSRNGQTIVWSGPVAPVIGKLFITQEAVAFSLNMSFKLAVMMSVFCWYEAVVSPDRAFSFFARLTPRSALALILTTLMLPQLRRRMESTALVMQRRGVPWQGENLLRRVRTVSPLLKTMLLSALEDSWGTAEALHARGFGLGRRSYFTKEIWRPADTVFLILTLAALTGFFVGLGSRSGFLNFYPRVGEIFRPSDIIFLAAGPGILGVMPFWSGWKWIFSKSNS